jgi:hypothetical protein
MNVIIGMLKIFIYSKFLEKKIVILGNIMKMDKNKYHYLSHKMYMIITDIHLNCVIMYMLFIIILIDLHRISRRNSAYMCYSILTISFFLLFHSIFSFVQFIHEEKKHIKQEQTVSFFF